jgi:hypothetical protein
MVTVIGIAPLSCGTLFATIAGIIDRTATLA